MNTREFICSAINISVIILKRNRDVINRTSVIAESFQPSIVCIILHRFYFFSDNIVVENYLEPRKFYRAQSGEAIMDSLADEMIKLFDANFSDTKIGNNDVNSV